MMRRWQRHHTISAHMIAMRPPRDAAASAAASSSPRPRSNAGVVA